METPEINHLLKLYFGADARGGYEPIYCEERLRSAYPNDYARLMELISPYLAEDHTPDWSKKTLSQAGALFAEILRQKFPELDSVTVQALSNRWAYGNK